MCALPSFCFLLLLCFPCVCGQTLDAFLFTSVFLSSAQPSLIFSSRVCVPTPSRPSLQGPFNRSLPWLTQRCRKGNNNKKEQNGTTIQFLDKTTQIKAKRSRICHGVCSSFLCGGVSPEELHCRACKQCMPVTLQCACFLSTPPLLCFILHLPLPSVTCTHTHNKKKKNGFLCRSVVLPFSPLHPSTHFGRHKNISDCSLSLCCLFFFE